MASVRKKPGSKFYYACFTGKDGVQRQASTKLTNRNDALTIALQWEQGYFTDRAEAKAIDQLRSIFADKRGETVTKITIEQFFNAWLEERRGELAVSSHERYKTSIDKLLSFLGARATRSLDQLNKEDLLALRKSHQDQVAALTANADFKILRIALNAAVKDGHIFKNPAKEVGLLQTSKKSVRRAFSQEEIQKLLDAADSEWSGLILFGLYSMQRLGDLARLKWGDVSDSIATIYRRKNGNTAIVPLHQGLVIYLATRERGQPSEAIFPTIFAQLESKTGRSSRLSNSFYALMVAAGLATKRAKTNTGKGHSGMRATNELSFHCLRHTGNTWLKNTGAGESIVRDIVGHESEEVSRVYSHVDNGTKDSFLQKMPLLKKTPSA